MTRNTALAGLVLLAVAGVFLLPPAVAALLAAGAVLAVVRLPAAPASSSASLSDPPHSSLSDFRAGIRPLLDALTEAVLLVDEREMVVVANRAAATLLGRSRESMEDVSLIRATRDHELLQVLREATGKLDEITLGGDRIVQVCAVQVATGPVRTVLTLHDLTPLRRAERARADLIANVSHELRTPITAALAIAETLESGVEEQEQRERFHRQLTAEIMRLGTMVERLLRLSRLESQTDEFLLEVVDAKALVAEAVGHMTPVAARKGITLLAEDASLSYSMVLVDRVRVLEVLANLLDNALRYSPEQGVVTVSLTEADVPGEERRGGMVRCCVRDQGPGILPAERQRIFERFYTTDRSRTGSTGTGLGLSIARHIVSRLGGTIWVADESPGAAICFTMPVGTTGGS